MADKTATTAKLVRIKLSPKAQLAEAVQQCWNLMEQRGVTLPAPLMILLGGRSPLGLILHKVETMTDAEAAELIRFIQGFGDGFDLSAYDELESVAARSKR